ncbi:MAG: glycosyltransferase, partial [Caulobacteraceae bacterium]|nr:glycosyltransferase [Caulobacteraceae bacterium]
MSGPAKNAPAFDVSVLIATYDRPLSLRQTLESVLAQR